MSKIRPFALRGTVRSMKSPTGAGLRERDRAHPDAAFREALAVALSKIDLRDVSGLRGAAVEVEQQRSFLATLVQQKEREIAAMRLATQRMGHIRDYLLSEADWLANRADFEEANEGRMEGKSPNPEVGG